MVSAAPAQGGHFEGRGGSKLGDQGGSILSAHFQERMTAALLDRLCHHCHIFEMNGESYRFRESMKSKKGRKSE
jgi:hypothetical protein